MMGMWVASKSTLTPLLFVFVALLTVVLLYEASSNRRAVKDADLHLRRLEGLILNSEKRTLETLEELDRRTKAAVRRLDMSVEPDVPGLEQSRRRQVVRDVCSQHLRTRSASSYFSIDPLYDQSEVSKSFLVEEKSKTIYCFNHKAASSMWMAAYVKLHGDENLTKEITDSEHYYKIKYVLQPKSSQSLLEKVHSGDYYTFTVVRHPFVRLLSSYRDRILDGCSDQAITEVPKILDMHGVDLQDLFTIGGCVTRFPTFSQFLSFVASDPSYSDSHWTTYSKNCATCIIDYDAIVKLETVETDQEYVMRTAGLGGFVNPEQKHQTHGGPTDNEISKEFYSQVPCHLLDRIRDIYRMDLQMFQYDTEQFYTWCREENI